MGMTTGTESRPALTLWKINRISKRGFFNGNAVDWRRMGKEVGERKETRWGQGGRAVLNYKQGQGLADAQKGAVLKKTERGKKIWLACVM